MSKTSYVVCQYANPSSPITECESLYAARLFCQHVQAPKVPLVIWCDQSERGAAVSSGLVERWWMGICIEQELKEHWPLSQAPKDDRMNLVCDLAMQCEPADDQQVVAMLNGLMKEETP